MNIVRIIALALILGTLGSSLFAQLTDIPLPEHPRPDFQRKDWINLNGAWEFQFDKDNKGEQNKWAQTDIRFNRKIKVPFPWGSPLSGIPDSADIGWYQRDILVPEDWENKRIFLVIGASDWNTKAWLDGQLLGEHKGGYTPFEFELSSWVKYGQKQKLVIKVDDTEYAFKLYGKQGYGNARGIWQTPYLEARGEIYVDHVHFTPDIDLNRLSIKGALSDDLTKKTDLVVQIQHSEKDTQILRLELSPGQKEFTFEISLDQPRLWTLDDPYLHDVTLNLEVNNISIDRLNTYFGFRKIGVTNLPGTDIPYVSLNNKPIYLQMSLDQAYHPEGYYTFPSDEFMRDEIIRSKKIGLNGQRIHVKIGIPRKLYWADKLGMLIMADIPNSWGEPDNDMRREIEYALRQMIKRDYNHPSIFSWVLFNETWGLFTKNGGEQRSYLPETQMWVTNMYQLATELDPSRLVEDNSACNYDHVKTDLNTWHAYLPGYNWDDRLREFSDNTYPGSAWNFAEGYRQSNQPNINSECGNVWGYAGSTGDVDWSWDYHKMINAFRKYPKIGGWLYTEHHDVINEWNGYYRYDRSEKYTGLESFNGMKLNDLHSYIQVTPDLELMTEVQPGQSLEIPVWLSVFTDNIPGTSGKLKYFIKLINKLGQEKYGQVLEIMVQIEPWKAGYIDPLLITVPQEEGLVTLHLQLETNSGTIINKNFSLFRVISDTEEKTVSENGESVSLTFDPASFIDQQWSLKQWNILDGLKINGAGYGHFTYELDISEIIEARQVDNITFIVELSAKQLYGKDRDDTGKVQGDYMRGKGFHDPSLNPNAYPMTDEDVFPSIVRIYINDHVIKEVYLPDDPADHRGVLSWHAQLKDRKLREAGSYGFLVEAPVPVNMIPEILKNKKIKIVLYVPESMAGGLAIYGEDFGRYPLNPTLIFLGNDKK